MDIHTPKAKFLFYIKWCKRMGYGITVTMSDNGLRHRRSHSNAHLERYMTHISGCYTEDLYDALLRELHIEEYEFTEMDGDA